MVSGGAAAVGTSTPVKAQPSINTSVVAVGLPGLKPDVTGTTGASEQTEPYPLEEPCYQRVGQHGNCLVYKGNALTPPLQEIH